MTTRKPTFKRIVVAGLLCAGAGWGLAQHGPGPRAEGMGHHDTAKMQSRMDQGLTALKSKLHVTAAQEAA